MCLKKAPCTIEDLDRKVTEVTEGLQETNRKLNTLLARMTDVKEKHEVSRLEEHYKELKKCL